MFLGLTLLSWGNSVGGTTRCVALRSTTYLFLCVADFVSDLAIAKLGFANMAMSAGIGGPLLSKTSRYP